MSGIRQGLGVVFLVCAAGAAFGREGKRMADCTTKVPPGAALQQELDRLPAGAVVCLAPGRYPGGLRVERSVTIRPGGPGDVVMDADLVGGVVQVASDRARVVLEGLTLSGGNWSGGGALAVTGRGAEVTLRGCRVVRNRARTQWLGAVVTVGHDNQVVLERCRVTDIDSDDESGPGQAIAVTQEARLVVRDSLVAGRAGKGGSLVAVRDGASVVIERSTLVNEGDGRALEVFGTTTDTPAVTVLDSIVSGGEAVRTENARVAVDRSVVHGEVVGAESLGPDTRRAHPAFERRDPEPYRPSASSPAVGLARGGGKDLAGRDRPDRGATAGAFEK